MPELTAVKTALRAQRIEVPSWAFGNTGTRFKVFAQPGVPRTVTEKIDDAAQVHRYTGIAPSVAVHIPWDKADDYPALAAYAAVNYASKKITNTAGQSFTAGKLGKYQVGAQHSILLGPPFVFTKANINQFNF